MSKRHQTNATPAARPLEKDEVNALERAHREAAETSIELHKAKVHLTELQKQFNAAKASTAALKSSLEASFNTIQQLSARLTA